MWTPPHATERFVEAIEQGDRVFIGQAITFLESLNTEKQAFGSAVLNRLLERRVQRNTFRIGISGAPGAGKSTFIEKVGKMLTSNGKKIAVLAIDPSSSLSRGSILGDKTRMEQLASDPNAYIRPSAAGDTLGGVARKTRETLLLLECAGYEYVLVETVGVGQSEIAVHGMTDLFVLLLQPGAGDELQGIKRGIVEMADILVVNKADGERMQQAKLTRVQYQHAVHLFPPKSSAWSPEVLECSALENTNLEDVLSRFQAFRTFILKNNWLEKNRRNQANQWWRDAMLDMLHAAFYNNKAVQKSILELENAVSEGSVAPGVAAQMVIDAFLSFEV